MEPAKALGLFRMGATTALDVFRLYGQGVYIPEVVAELERLALQLHTNLGNTPPSPEN